jgi:hypothetical protein
LPPQEIGIPVHQEGLVAFLEHMAGPPVVPVEIATDKNSLSILSPEIISPLGEKLAHLEIHLTRLCANLI